MPARRTKPLPTSRMVQLLATEKRRLLAEQGHVTEEDFRHAWAASWALMVTSRAWPHATEHRRHWRKVMIATKPEIRAAFLGQPTAFSRLASALMLAGEKQQVTLTTDDLPRVLLGAIAAGYLHEEQPEPMREEIAA